MAQRERARRTWWRARCARRRGADAGAAFSQVCGPSRVERNTRAKPMRDGAPPTPSAAAAAAAGGLGSSSSRCASARRGAGSSEQRTQCSASRSVALRTIAAAQQACSHSGCVFSPLVPPAIAHRHTEKDRSLPPLGAPTRNLAGEPIITAAMEAGRRGAARLMLRVWQLQRGWLPQQGEHQARRPMATLPGVPGANPPPPPRSTPAAPPPKGAQGPWGSVRPGWAHTSHHRAHRSPRSPPQGRRPLPPSSPQPAAQLAQRRLGHHHPPPAQRLHLRRHRPAAQPSHPRTCPGPASWCLGSPTPSSSSPSSASPAWPSTTATRYYTTREALVEGRALAPHSPPRCASHLRALCALAMRLHPLQVYLQQQHEARIAGVHSAIKQEREKVARPTGKQLAQVRLPGGRQRGVIWGVGRLSRTS